MHHLLLSRLQSPNSSGQLPRPAEESAPGSPEVCWANREIVRSKFGCDTTRKSLAPAATHHGLSRNRHSPPLFRPIDAHRASPRRRKTSVVKPEPLLDLNSFAHWQNRPPTELASKARIS